MTDQKNYLEEKEQSLKGKTATYYIYTEIINYANTELKKSQQMTAQKKRTQFLHGNDTWAKEEAYIWSAWTSTLLASHEYIFFFSIQCQQDFSWLTVVFGILKFQETGLLGKERPHTKATELLQVQKARQACLLDTPKETELITES